MCLGLPGELIERYEDRGTAMGHVAFGAITKEVCLSLVPDAVVGDHVIVHAGVAIAVLDVETAMETLELFAQIDFGGER